MGDYLGFLSRIFDFYSSLPFVHFSAHIPCHWLWKFEPILHWMTLPQFIPIPKTSSFIYTFSRDVWMATLLPSPLDAAPSMPGKLPSSIWSTDMRLSVDFTLTLSEKNRSRSRHAICRDRIDTPEPSPWRHACDFPENPSNIFWNRSRAWCIWTWEHERHENALGRKAKSRKESNQSNSADCCQSPCILRSIAPNRRNHWSMVGRNKNKSYCRSQHSTMRSCHIPAPFSTSSFLVVCPSMCPLFGF
jgi:hypothetical protein